MKQRTSGSVFVLSCKVFPRVIYMQIRGARAPSAPLRRTNHIVNLSSHSQASDIFVEEERKSITMTTAQCQYPDCMMSPFLE